MNRDASGEPPEREAEMLSLLATLRETTRRLETLTASDVQAASELSFRQMAEHISDVCFLQNLDSSQIYYVNPAYERVWGRTRESLYANPKSWAESIHPDDLAHAFAKFTENPDVGFDYEFRIIRPDGDVRWIHVRGFPILDEAGHPYRTAGIASDITARRHMERQLLQSQKLEAIGSLAAGIAHEINTPTQYVGDNVRFLADGVSALTGLVTKARSLADVVRTRPEFADAVAAFDRAIVEADLDYLLTEMPLAAVQAREGCDRISDIVGAMKGFSYSNGSERQLVDLNAAVRDTIAVCQNEWKYVAAMLTELDAAMPLVPCSQGELQQVVLNLILNAAHAVFDARGTTGALGTIAVSTRFRGDWAEIRVQDDGCGIPDSIRGRVFDPFFTTKQVGAGTGQGLSAAYETVVRKHHGTLTFESAERGGTTFIICLPLDGPAEDRAAA